jgi:hypothetical protein
MKNKKRQVCKSLKQRIFAQFEEMKRKRLMLKSFGDLSILLKSNNYSFKPYDNEELENVCVDILTFGTPESCKNCDMGPMVITKNGYVCSGFRNEWDKCVNFIQNPRRKKCVIPFHWNVKSSQVGPQFRSRLFFKKVSSFIEPRSSSVEESLSIEDNFESSVSSEVNPAQRSPVAVDPMSNLRLSTQVLQLNRTVYNCLLINVNIRKSISDFYKMQVLEFTKLTDEKKFVLFHRWGRLDNLRKKFEYFDSMYAAMNEFERIFKTKTANEWRSRSSFTKFAGKFYNTDFDYFGWEVMDQRLKNLIEIVCQPQGNISDNVISKLSTKQLKEAVNTIQQLCQKHSSWKDLIMLSNKLFTLIPKELQTKNEIFTKEVVERKLTEINSVISFREEIQQLQLCGGMTVIDPATDEHDLIETYVQNTSVHGKRLTIVDVFKVNRRQECACYEPFENSPNRMLLWHGSKNQNIASIIKHGLKIMQQANGSMFGRGIQESARVKTRYLFVP